MKTIFHLNSLWPSDTIWQQRSGSTLAQVMACCLTAPSHYLNQCWLIISKVQWHSSECSFTKDTSTISHWNYLENYLSNFFSNLQGANELTHKRICIWNSTDAFIHHSESNESNSEGGFMVLYALDVSRYNITRYHTQCNEFEDKTSARLELMKDTHNSLLWASYGCLSWFFWEKWPQDIVSALYFNWSNFGLEYQG